MYLDSPRQIEKDNKFKTENIDPLVDSVKRFITINNRIPNGNEFHKLNVDSHGELLTNYADLPDEFKEKIKIDNWDKDTYAIAVWRGEWNEGYISKNEIYILNEYTWTEGLNGLLIIFVIGLLPILLTLLVSKFKR